MKKRPPLRVLALAIAALSCSMGAAQAVEYQFHQRVRGLVVAPAEPVAPEAPAEPEVVVASSCLDLKAKRPEAPSGVHAITVGGKAFDVYCDMESAGGGWTLVVAQFETDPVTNWNEGIQADYDPSLASSRGFALSSAQLPAHTQTAFGRDLDADFVDYVNMRYSTGGIAKTLVSGLKNARSYHVHRDGGSYYSTHNPESTFLTGNQGWRNTLTFDATGVAGFNWAFSPVLSLYPVTGYNSQLASGFSMAGAALAQTQESFAWTVWVR
jgi:hypothetical protein